MNSLIEIARAIADGQTIDWAAIERQSSDDRSRRVLTHLRAIEHIVKVHNPETVVTQSLEDAAGPSEMGGKSDVTPVTWGSLTILAEVGRGTFGNVYRAYDARLDRHVALKLLRRGDHDQEASGSAVIEEARLMARVNHPNVVTVHGAERIDGRVGVWMEFVEGHTLDAELRANGPMGSQVISQIGISLSAALTAVHEAGLLHQDLKAQNVMRDSSGRIVLTDFGAGRERSSERSPGGRGDLAGTPLYLAPEVLVGRPATAQSEIYALGVLLFHLSTGSFPVLGRSLREVRDAHDTGTRRKIATVAGSLPPGLATVIDRACDPDPSRRYQSASEMESVLRGLSTPVDRRQQRRKWGAAAAVAAAVIFSVFSWLQYRRSTAGIQAVTPSSGSEGRTMLAQATSGLGPHIRKVDASWLSNVVVGNPEPGGRWLICVDKTTRRLARCMLASGSIDVLPGIPPVSMFGALLSGDGRRVAYVRQSSGFEFRTVSLDGSDDRLIMKFQDNESPTYLHGWSWVGDTIVGVLTGIGKITTTLVLPPGEAPPRRLPLANWGPGRMSLSSDQRYIVSDGRSSLNHSYDLKVVDVESGAERLVESGIADEMAPLWSQSDQSIIFARNDGGFWHLWRRGRGDSDRLRLGRLESEKGEVRALGSDGNGVHFYRVQQVPRMQAVTVDFDSGEVTPSTVATCLGLCGPAGWASDRRNLAHLELDPRGFRTATGTVVITDTERRVAPQHIVLPGAFPARSIRWSPNGRRLVVCCTLTGTRAWVLDPRPSSSFSAPIRLIDLPVAVGGSGPSFDHTSTAIYYPSGASVRWRDIKSRGDREVYRGNVTVESVILGSETRGEIFISTQDGGAAGAIRSSIRSVRVADGTGALLYEAEGVIKLATFVDGPSPQLLFARQSIEPMGSELLSLSLATEKTKALSLSKGYLESIDASADGRRIAFWNSDPGGTLWLVSEKPSAQ